MDNNDRTIKIAQWNCRSLRKRKDTIEAHLHKYDIIALQETHHTKDLDTRLPGYYAHDIKKGTGNNGLVLYIRDTIPATLNLKQVKVNEYELTNSTVYTKPPINITNLYRKPHGTTTPKVFELPNKIAPDHRHIILGDFNAHHRLWGSDGLIGAEASYRIGNTFHAQLEESELVCINDGTPTTTNGTCIDLTITDRRTATDATWEVSHDHVSDCHYLISTEIYRTRLPDPCPFQPKWKLDKANWEGYKTALNRNLKEAHDHMDNDSQDLNSLVQATAQAIIKAAEENIPKTRPSPKPHEAWFFDDQCKQMQALISSATQVYKKTKAEEDRIKLRQLQQDQRTTLKQIKTQAFQKHCEQFNHRTSLSALWNLVKKAGGAYIPPTSPPINPQQEANKTIKNFADRSASCNLSQETRTKLATNRRHQELVIGDAKRQMDDDTDPEFTLTELQLALNHLNKTSPGDDDIHNLFLTNGTPELAESLLQIINASWNSGRLYPTWKQAHIVPIPKKEPGQYRPISLLPTIGKLMERMVLKRLDWKVGKLHPQVNGFRKNRSTQDCIAQVINKVTETKTSVRRAARPSAAVFIDLEKAFELANKNAILSALTNKFIKGKLLRWIDQYLTNRQARTQISGTYSRYETFENGTPQGSVISPFLFNILMEVLVSQNYQNVTVISYADDIVFIANGEKPVQSLQKALQLFSNICTEIGLKISTNKTKAIYFTKTNTKDYKPTTNLQVTGEDIEWVDSYKYLGITIDRKTNFTEHFNNVISTCSKKLNVMKAMTGLECGASTKTMKTLYTTTIRSLIEYSAIPYMLTSQTNKDKLQRIQNRGLRLALQAHQSTPIDSLHQEMDLPLIHHRIQQIIGSHALRILSSNDNNPLHDILQTATSKDRRSYPYNTWALCTADVVNKLNIEKVNNEAETKPPWYSVNATIMGPKLTGRKSDLNPESLRKDIEIYMDSITTITDTVFYTDGSVNSDNGRSGYAVVTKDNTTEVRTSDNLSSTQTELAAIKKALTIAIDQETPTDVLIHSDSQSALQAVAQSHPLDNIPMIRSIHDAIDTLQDNNQNVTLNWIPSHIGIQGNEAADQAAKNATEHEEIDEPTLPALSQAKATIKAKLKADFNLQATAKPHKSASRYWHDWIRTNARPPNLEEHIRKHQSLISRIRIGHTPYHIRDTPCHLCHQSPRTTIAHYLAECPVTHKYRQAWLQKLPPEEHTADQEQLALNIVKAASQNNYHPLLDALDDYPLNPPKEQH